MLSRLNNSLNKFESRVVEQSKKSDDLWYFDPIKIWMDLGQIVMLELYDMSSDDLKYGEVSDLSKAKSIRLPAVVVSVIHDDPLSGPMYKLSISNRWSDNGVLGGTFCLDHFPAWRYLSKDQSIPKSFIDSINDSMDQGEEHYSGLSVNSLFYTEVINETTRKLIYPFSKSDVNYKIIDSNQDEVNDNEASQKGINRGKIFLTDKILQVQL